MRNKKKLFIITLALSIFLCTFSSIHAHTMWVNVSNYSPKIQEGSIVYFGWGHHYPVDGFLSGEKLQDFCLISPIGKKEKLNPSPAGFLATKINFSSGGTYIVTASLKPGFYTMYIEKGKIHHRSVPKTGLKNIILSLYFEQYAKALINTAESSKSFSNKVGHKLEIIPLKHPNKLKIGDWLPIQILFQSKPARYCKVYGTYSGFSTEDDFAYTTNANGEGKAKIRILHYGPWLIKTDIKLPAPVELKDKCNELHYTATLTFEVQ